MSTSKNHEESFILVLMNLRAVWQPLLGLKPNEESKKVTSNIGSIMDLTTSCTNLSFIDGIPRGRIIPCFSGLGFRSCLTPFHLYSLFNTASFNSSIFLLVKESMLLGSGTGVFDPLFLLSFK
jgi:hypothetical protein